MDLDAILAKANGIVGGMSSMFGEGDPDPKKKKPFDWGAELKAGYKKKLMYDNQTVGEVVKAAAKEGKIDPSELLSSAWVEGLNLAATKPGSISEAYHNATAGVIFGKSRKGDFINENQPVLDETKFPVDGFLNYGIDTFGNNYSALKKYLPQNFKEGQNFQFFDALNESGDRVKTAAFKTNKDALLAKAAFYNMEKERASSYAKNKYGVDLDDKAKTYFTMAAYNGGPGAAQKMIDEYVTAEDKDKFIDEGQTKYLGGKVHRNISPRMKLLSVANELLTPKPAPMPSPQQILTQ